LASPNEYSAAEFVGSFWNLPDPVPRQKEWTIFSKKFTALKSKSSDRFLTANEALINSKLENYCTSRRVALDAIGSQMCAHLSGFACKAIVPSFRLGSVGLAVVPCSVGRPC
jgi:hypothetical protein